MKVVPCTLEVGDYIISPKICIERKSLLDLTQSFVSGRLYTQVESMSQFYDVPTLLIEFDEKRLFEAGFTEVNGFSAYEIQNKIVLLCITFPKLRVIWSEGSRDTADIFYELKVLN